MQIHETGIKIHPGAVCGGFPLDSFLSESSKCEGVEKQPAVLHVSCGSRAGNTAAARSRTDSNVLSGAMPPILFVLLENMLFSCFIAPSVTHWQWWLSLLLLGNSLSCFSVENWILDKIVLLKVFAFGGKISLFLLKIVQRRDVFAWNF